MNLDPLAIIKLEKYRFDIIQYKGICLKSLDVSFEKLSIFSPIRELIELRITRHLRMIFKCMYLPFKIAQNCS